MTSYPKYALTTEELSQLLSQSTETIADHLNPEKTFKLKSGKTGIYPDEVRRYLNTLGLNTPYGSIVHINLKGGTGKTTTAITSATRCAQYGFKTCILDLDSQSSASLAFDALPEDEDLLFSDLWQNPQGNVVPALKQLDDYLYILPSSLDNSLLDVQLINPSSQKNAVRNVCEELKHNGFDLVMIDCPPSLGAAVISSICAAQTIVIPVCADAFSVKGVELTINEINAICDTFNLDKPKVHILFTKVDNRLSLTEEIYSYLNEQYPDQMLPVKIHTSSIYPKFIDSNETVFASTRKLAAKSDYDDYVQMLLGLDKIA